MIAMALSCQPSLLIADEPTTALDVTTEAQILELMRDIRQSYDVSVMYITPRCRYAQPHCSTDEPRLVEYKPEHFVACHYAGQLDLRGVASL